MVKRIIGVDLGGTNLRVALLTQQYKIVDKYSLSTRKFEDKDGLISAILHAIDQIIENNDLAKANIVGVGLGLPGPVDTTRGIVHTFTNIPGWKEVNLKRILEQKLDIPVRLDNDTNLMCLAEYRLGKAKGLKNVVCLTLGTGVGGGIIIDGKLYRGSNFVAGELGHMPINEEGPRCKCGGVACLEAYIGNSRIKSEAQKLFRRDISLEELSALSKRGDARARYIWSELGRRLGIALVGAVNLLNPDAIVIGGGIANAGEVLFSTAKKTIAQRAMKVASRHVKVLKAQLGNDAGLIGAAILVKEGA